MCPWSPEVRSSGDGQPLKKIDYRHSWMLWDLLHFLRMLLHFLRMLLHFVRMILFLRTVVEHYVREDDWNFLHLCGVVSLFP